MKDFILDLIYPRRCPICFKIVKEKGKKICNSCRKHLIYIKEPKCKKCSKPIEQVEEEYCIDCNRRKFSYEYGLALWVYNDYLKKSISNFKNKNKIEYSDFYVDEIIKSFGKKIKEMNVDALIPIPLHKRKHKARGYNQAEIIANKIGKSLDIKVISNLINRTMYTKPQKDLNDKERLLNLKDAFIINNKHAEKYKNKLKKVIIVDDIYTTGSTIESCTKVLLAYGIKEVFFITLSIGKGY